MLKQMARRLLHATRSYDMAGRYGGEEFLVLLPGCGPDQTLGSAERLRSAVAAEPFGGGGQQIPLIVSIGATVVPDFAQSETEILSLADAALYRAKSEGRNRTVLGRSLDQQLPTAR